jgi:hypothetical protein
MKIGTKLISKYDINFSRGMIPVNSSCEIIEVEEADKNYEDEEDLYLVYTENYKYDGCYGVAGEDDTAGTERLSLKEITEWFDIVTE